MRAVKNVDWDLVHTSSYNLQAVVRVTGQLCKVLVKGATKICPSKKKFDVSKMEFQQTESVNIKI